MPKAKRHDHLPGAKGRSYEFGDRVKSNNASQRPLIQASLRCKRWLKPSSLHRIPTPLKRCWMSHLQALSTIPLPSGVRVEGKDQRADLPCPVPPPALDPKDRHHTGHAGSEQRQRIKGALADPQWTRASLQRGGVKVTLGTREMVMALGLRHLLGSGILVMLTD